MDTTFRFIGDVHGKYPEYKRIIKSGPPSIQVGDMGIGFRRTDGTRQGEFHQNPPHKHMVDCDAKFIRGNHDNPGECRKNSQWIEDGYTNNGTMFIGGAESVDREWRTEGYNWWADEQISYQELADICRKFLEVKPKTVISHDCPSEVAAIMCNHRYKPVSRTQEALQQMWNGHSPELWIYGHWHQHCWLDLEKDKKNTKFICLNELEYLDVDLAL